MMTKRENQQIEMHLITIEDLVPMDHLFRKVNDIIDFSFIYNEVENMYCHNNGRPSIDPVVLIKFKGKIFSMMKRMADSSVPEEKHFRCTGSIEQ